MQKVVFETPGLFGDHHVVEVRKQLLAKPGIAELYASSAFRVIEVTFDEAKISQADIQSHLQSMGYLAELPYQTELENSPEAARKTSFFRTTAAYSTTPTTVSFKQTVSSFGSSHMTCPGFEINKPMDN
jgi:hypothetical protein